MTHKSPQPSNLAAENNVRLITIQCLTRRSPATVINALQTPFLRLPLPSYCSIVPESGRHHKLYKLKFILSPNVAMGLRPRKILLYVTRSSENSKSALKGLCFELLLTQAMSFLVILLKNKASLRRKNP